MTDPKLATATDMGRMYSRQIGGPPHVPSITTVISMDRPDLSGWAGYMAAKSLSEDRELSQALQSPGRLRSMVRHAAEAAERYRDVAAARGDRVHAYCEQVALRDLGMADEVDAARERLREFGEERFAEHFDGWYRQYAVKPLAAEATVWNHTLGYAGTIDLVAEIGGRVCLVDYKTRGSDRQGQLKPVDAKVMMQLAAAAKAEEMSVDAVAGTWDPWKYDVDVMLLAVGIGETEARTYQAPPESMPGQWAKFCALHRLWTVQRQIAEEGAALREVGPPPSAAVPGAP